MDKRINKVHKMAAALVFLITVCPGGAAPQVRETSGDALLIHIPQPLSQMLPSFGMPRPILQKSTQGIHYSWMDDMRRDGVKLARVLIFTGVNDPPKDWRIEETAYYSKYDPEGSQITDPKWLGQIHESGLADELNRVALDRAPHSDWHTHDSAFIPIDLFDDESLPPTRYVEVRAHILKIAATLSPNSDLRYFIQEGALGDGIHYSWMDDMRREGVKEADLWADIEFNQDGTPKTMKLSRARYYAEYDSQVEIQESARLERIRATGLEEELGKVALQRAARGSWVDVPRPRPNPFLGGARVPLVDDEWLPEPRSPLFFAR